MYDIENIFTYHAPIGNQAARYQVLRAAAKELADLLQQLTPYSREQSLALTKLEEAIFWANAGIARNETENTANVILPVVPCLDRSISEIARAAHEVNRWYCRAMGDHSQLPWDEAPEWQKQIVVNGVHFLMQNPDAPVSASHDNWFAEKANAGWIYGEVKDAEAKTHPCMVSFDDLPPEQQAKDYLFKGVVLHLLSLRKRA